MNEYLSPEDLAALTAFAQDDRAQINPEQIERLGALHRAVERNALKNLTGLRKRNAMLSEKIEHFRDKEKLKISVEDFAETGLDSYEVALGLLYQLQQLKTYRLTKKKFISILYEMYASWLHSKQERLFLEHPVASFFGPQFWRVYERISLAAPVQYKDWKSLCEKNPGVAAFCKNAAEKYYDYAEGDLLRPLTKSLPFRNADKDHNGGKWNKEIADKQIYAWKDARKPARQQA